MSATVPLIQARKVYALIAARQVKVKAEKQPSVVPERVGPRKYELLKEGKLREAGFDDVTAAVGSFLTYSALKHLLDREKIAADFEASPLHANWPASADIPWPEDWTEKWRRLGKSELDKAIDRARALMEKQKNRGAKQLRHQAQWRRLSQAEKRKVRWLWKGRIPIGMLAMFAGDPSLGKSTMAFDIIARGSVGASTWLDGQPNECGQFDSIVLIAEDDVSSIVRPRIEAAGGDPDKVHELVSVQLIDPDDDNFKEERMATLESDLDAIRERILAFPDIKLVFVDPLSNYLGSKDLMKEQEIRRVLSPVRRLAEELDVTFLFNAHFNKQQGKSAIHKVIGAVGNIGICRIGWSFVKSPKDPENLKEMLLMKENLGKSPGIVFTTESVDVEIEGEMAPQARIKYIGASETSIENVLAEAENTEGKRESAAIRLIKTMVLKGQEVRSDLIIEKGEENGIRYSALDRARRALNLDTRKKKDGWYWRWPDGTATPAEEQGQDPIPF